MSIFIVLVGISTIIWLVYLGISWLVGENVSLELWLIIFIFLILISAGIKIHSKIKNGGFG
jgi:hypothetical protein